MNVATINFGTVKHKRFRPVKNAFGYGVFTLSIPMRSRAKHKTLLTQHGLGDNQFKLFSFFDKDHGHGDADSLQWIERILTENHIAHVDGEIWLQTFPRVLGYVFNPVSFWICTRANGQVQAVLAEVNNTFGERHCYLLHENDGSPLQSGKTFVSQKVFHVSPFCDVSGEYHFRFLFPQDSKSKRNSVCRIELHEDGKPLINTSISGLTQSLSRKELYLAFLRYPLMSLGVIGRIHWQALKLWIKGVPFHTKPKPPALEVTR
ncbi:MAG: DUF1365 domain-containing protein [Polynucleobacter sp. 24-46-87]|jgi:DUF1365 family protein|uniref:DUF1365 domain-containing protein n=1 Tax=Polaromonas sp. 17-63-33 TaxID=1970413 RepID=UPI000BD88A08|nr:DUF1365 domain-containing protein [Polaromonas sp. 17-63-33]OYY58743.1 MAG: DUF1365 domain-containing protein [Polynucleobacter sp. 35-46-207]OZA13202.1 MAG: DUF1365 domain-containing protein [Polynucleobacter sp. 24-46-87]OZA45002.1 MAG: DUF1365 domain-containing protein [Polaromonas sp. 17-63-33]OZB48673.1 MAG: DUF1365 domain-containing protein [Polynucleobacter sp. 39-45-136]